jgi:predicted acylesterase/phospholipase RssA
MIRESEVKLRVAATDWSKGTVKIFTNIDITDDYAVRFILASTAIPGLFPPVFIDGDWYVDGGLVLNTPLLPAMRAGAATLHVIYLDPSVSSIPVSSLQSTLDTMTRMYAIQFAAKMNEDVKRAAQVNRTIASLEQTGASDRPGAGSLDVLTKAAGVQGLRKVTIHRYHPRDELGSGILGWLDFSSERIQALIDRGFTDAVAHDCFRSECLTADGEFLTRPSDELLVEV